MTTESQRRGVIDMLHDALWCTASDHEIADELDVTPALVRELRAAEHRVLLDAEIVDRLHRLAALVRWPSDGQSLLLAVLDAELARARLRRGKHRNGAMQALRTALAQRDEEKRPRALESMAAPQERAPNVSVPSETDATTGDAHARQRSRAPGQARGGISRDRDSRSAPPRDGAWGHGRPRNGPLPAVETREG
jgi:hypothetical protein